MVYIYVLKLQDNKYYVGKSDNLQARISQHTSGIGSKWTKKHPPVDIDDIFSDCDDFDEDKYVKIYMAKYGIDNVRGGTYCQIILDNKTKKFLENEIRGMSNKCYNCGQSDHFIKDCKKKNCARCGRQGHLTNHCYARWHVSGKQLISKRKRKNSAEDGIQIPRDENKICFRCGRKGHLAQICYAKKHLNSESISWDGCTNCGRRSHWAIRCGKNKDIYGRKVTPALLPKIGNLIFSWFNN